MYKLLSRKLLGDRYSSALKGIIIAVIIGCGLHELGTVVPLAQSVLIFSAICFSGTIIIQTLGSADNARCLKGLFAMPHDDRKNLREYAVVIGLYTLCTKTSLLAALLFAFVKLTAADIAIFFLCFLYALFGGFAAFGLFRRMPVVSALIAAVPVILLLLRLKGIPAIITLAAADAAAALLFSTLHLDDFYVQESANRKSTGHSSKAPKLLILRYITRYLLANKSYIFSMLFITGFGCFFAIMTDKQGLQIGCGIGLAFSSLNTPLATIVSANRGLDRKLNALPGKTGHFFVPYAAVLVCCNLVIYALFLAIYAIAGGQIDIRAFITAGIFALESAAMTALLEDRFTLTKWKTEPDLWHHPRKYILPVILVLEAALIYFI